MRQIILDTETTGIGEGHRIVEIGCLELIERKPTGRTFHVSSSSARHRPRGTASTRYID